MTAKRVALYLRVSTSGQTVDNQRRELVAVARRHGWQIVETFSDAGASGADPGRRGFRLLREAIARRSVELVAAWSVDRLGRTLQELVEFMGELQAKGVGLYLHQQGIDTTTPAGKAMFQMLGVFAEFERTIISERIKSGQARARSQGARIGRPRLSADTEARALAMLKNGHSIGGVALALKTGRSAIQRIKRESRARS